MIYEGLVAFRSGKTNTLVKDNLVQNIKQNDIKKSGKNNRTSEQNINEDNIKDSGIRHIVKKGESLGSLSNKYHVKVSDIIKLNQLKRKTLWLNESIKIPDNVEIKNKSLTIKENDFHKKQNSSVNNTNKDLKKRKIHKLIIKKYNSALS